MSDIKCPTCPKCGGPDMAAGMLANGICGNDDCDVFTWDRYSTPEENLADAHEVGWTSTPLEGGEH